MIDLFLASGNAHKALEFSELFDPNFIRIKAAPQKLEVLEDGKTFHENAFLKAQAYFQMLGQPVMADDSGITVLALPDELGIHSARFGGESLSDKERAMLLLEKLEGKMERNAFFTCVLCFYLNKNEIFYFEGRMSGRVGFKYRGNQGFGYDPIFIPHDLENEATLAEAGDWKNKHSHRAQASVLAQKFFLTRV